MFYLCSTGYFCLCLNLHLLMKERNFAPKINEMLMALNKKIMGSLLGLMVGLPVMGQFTHGTTGLLSMPTADMQKDRTVMLGGGYLSKYATPYRWNYDTWNYYANITFFPWLEVSYTCTIFDGDILRGNTRLHVMNQDRNFAIRLRAWKEGWWKPWTPQIVLGVNDFTTGSGEDYASMGVGGDGNGYWNRYYVAMTKHVDFQSVGELGLHASYVYNERTDNPLNGVAVGMNFRFHVKGESFWTQLLNGLNLMAEAYPANGNGGKKTQSIDGEKHYSRGLSAGKYDFNVGASYSVWKDRINLYGHLYGCKDFSTGLQFKICLK